MSEVGTHRTRHLGDISPTGTRHAGRRSAVGLTEGLVVAGTADGAVAAFGRERLDEQWRATPRAAGDAVVTVEPVNDWIVVGERSPTGAVRCYDTGSGTLCWQYETVDDIGPPSKESRFFLPFVVDIEQAGEVICVAARRYERDGDSRSFRSIVYAFEGDGTVRWTHETDASPITLDGDGDRIAVAYNRCSGEHQHGLVVLDSESGAQRYHWDPGTGGQRRVGDVSLCTDGVALACHGDFRGYRLESGGAERWRVPLATPRDIDGERLYAYPNNVYAGEEGVMFLTGNTYAVGSRETESLHPREHTVFGFSPVGERIWMADNGGFAHGIDGANERVAVPAAQQFRTRDANTHGLSVFEIGSGRSATYDANGVVTATAIDDDCVVAIEEPVSYHDQETVYGSYNAHLYRIGPDSYDRV